MRRTDVVHFSARSAGSTACCLAVLAAAGCATHTTQSSVRAASSGSDSPAASGAVPPAASGSVPPAAPSTVAPTAAGTAAPTTPGTGAQGGSTIALPSGGAADPAPGLSRRLTLADNGTTVNLLVGTRLTVDLAGSTGAWQPITITGTALTAAEQSGAGAHGQPLAAVLHVTRTGRATLATSLRPGGTTWWVSIQVRGRPLPVGAANPT